MEKADLMMHPVRMRIILALSRRSRTTKQLGAELPEVATATLYHHLGLLTKAGLIQVVEERQVRGTLEKTYALAQEPASLSSEDLAQASRDDLLRYFQVFVSALLGDYARYLQHHEPGAYADMGYRQVPLYLSDEEFDHFTQAFAAAMRPWREHQPGPGRRRRLFTTIVIPEVDTQEHSSDQD